MLSGKAVERAICGFFNSSMLNTPINIVMLISKTFYLFAWKLRCKKTRLNHSRILILYIRGNLGENFQGWVSFANRFSRMAI